jgi:hypothetical protein
MMAHYRPAFIVTGPVTTGAIIVTKNRQTKGIRSSQYVVAIGTITTAIDNVAILIDGAALEDIVTVPFDVTMEFSNVAGDAYALGIVPWASTDSITGVDGIVTLGAEIRAPGTTACTGGFSETLAVSVSPGQAAEVAAITNSYTGNKKGHGFLFFLGKDNSARQGQCDNCKNGKDLTHVFPLLIIVCIYK